MATKKRWYRRALFHAIFWPAFVVLALVVTWLGWGWHASHRFAATKARLHAAGYRIYPTDFPDGAALPKDQNGFNDFFDAMEAFRLEPADRDLISGANIKKRSRDFFEIQRTPDEITQMRALLRKDVLDAADRIVTRSQVVWPRAVFDDVWFARNHERLIIHLEDLARLMSQVALFDHRDGHDQEALRNLHRIILLSRVAAQDPIIVMQLDGEHARWDASDALRRMMPDLHVEDTGVIQEARQLMVDLVDDTAQRDGMAWAFQGEMTGMLPGYDLLAANRAALRGPFFLESASGSLDQWEAMTDVARAPDWWHAKPLIARVPTYPVTETAALFHFFEQIATDRIVGFCQYRDKSLVQTRAAAILLAAALHEQSHMGPAQTAADLIPDELQQLPLDPFADNDQPLHYRLDLAGPVVWSVGENGKDDGGTGDDLVFGLPAKGP